VLFAGYKGNGLKERTDPNKKLKNAVDDSLEDTEGSLVCHHLFEHRIHLL